MADPLHDDSVLLRRPHYTLRGEALHFLISRRPSRVLAPAERELWEALEAAPTVAQLRARFGRDVDTSVQRFLDLQLCEVVPGSFPAGRRRVVVIEPHMDDAVLSVGGRMWLDRNATEFVVLAIAGRSNFTSYYYLDRDFFDEEAVSALRRQESELAARLLGARFVPLGEREAPLRYYGGRWSLEWFRRHRKPIGTFIFHASGPADREAWTTAVQHALAGLGAQEIWLPLGVGMHTDHELTRHAVFAALERDPELLRRHVVRLYQDVPYANNYREHTEAIVRDLTAAGAVLEPEIVDIREAMPAKLRLSSIFGSQFKMEVLGPGIEGSARNAGLPDGAFGELLYRVVSLPSPAARALYAGKGVGAPPERVARWLRRHRETSRIRVISPSGMGRWAESMQFLLETFPRARFEVHLAADYAAETEAFTSPRIDVRAVAGRRLRWMLHLARVAASWPAPTLVLPGSFRRRFGQALGRLFALGDPLVANTMSDAIVALERARSAEKGP